jgi:hypothetical protein
MTGLQVEVTSVATAGGRGDVWGRFESRRRQVGSWRGDVWGRFTAVVGSGAASGGDVWGRFAVSTAGAWSLYSLATPTDQGDGGSSC